MDVKYCLECILNGTFTKLDKDNIIFVIGFHDFVDNTQYACNAKEFSGPDKRVVSNSDNVITIIDDSENIKNSFMEVLYPSLENDSFSIRSISVYNDSFTFTFKELIQEILNILVNDILEISTEE